PDASKDGKAFARWSKVADDLNKTGYRISVSDLLEQRANDEQKQAGLDLADFLLRSDPTPEKAPLQPASELTDLPVVVRTVAEQLANPGATLKPDESEITRFAEVVTDGSYPASWDEPNPPGAKPCISATSFHQWQQQHKYYGRHGVASLTPQPPP
ncbi:MAG: hypothetical protein H7319_13720, partial [Spirosoma sp.]|nr:hypothetical protein [Spirosoma sp.]